MKFIVSNDLSKHKGMSFFLLVFFFFSGFFLILGPWVEKSKWGLTADEISNNILGNAELFVAPMTLELLVSQIHVDFFIHLFLLVMALSVLFRSEYSSRFKVRASFFVLLSCGLNISAPLLLYIGVESAAWLKLLGFWGLTFGLGFVIFFNMIYLVRGAFEKKHA